VITVGMLVSNRCESMIACIKKCLPDEIRVHVVPDAHKIADMERHVLALADGGVDTVIVDMSNIPPGGLFFDVIIYDCMSGEPPADKSAAKYIHNGTIVISNGDDGIIPEFMNGTRLCAVTYGLSQKCSVTPSCIDTCDGLRFNCCIQRGIPAVSGAEIELGEYAAGIGGANVNIYDALAAVTLGMVLR